MRTDITEEERRRLLDRAISAVQAWTEAASVTNWSGEGVTAQLRDRAVVAVTAAVVDGGHVHTLISARVAMSGRQLIGLIADEAAYAEAVVVELHAAELYAEQLKADIGGFALRTMTGYGDRARVARMLRNMRPATLDKYIDKARAANTPGALPAWLLSAADIEAAQEA